VSAPSIPTACRTAVVLGFLLALALAGRGGWATGALAAGLVGVWLAPLVVRHGRRPAGAEPVTADPLAAEAPAA
jgi:hypothetical protein